MNSAMILPFLLNFIVPSCSHCGAAAEAKPAEEANKGRRAVAARAGTQSKPPTPANHSTQNCQRRKRQFTAPTILIGERERKCMSERESERAEVLFS
jgi:hypothetical protein